MPHPLIDVDASRLRATGRLRTRIPRAAISGAPELRQAVERIIGHQLVDGELDADLDPETAAAVRDRVQVHLAGGSLAPACVPFHCFEAIRELIRSGQLTLTLEIAPIRSGSNALLRALLHSPGVAAVAKNLSRRFAAGSDRFWGCILNLYAAHRQRSAPVRIVYKDHWIAVPSILESQLLEAATAIVFVVRDPVKVAFSVAHALTAADELLASILAQRLSPPGAAAIAGTADFLADYARRAGFADWPALQEHTARDRDYRPLEVLFRQLGLDDEAAASVSDDETGDELVRRHPAALLASWRQLARLTGQVPAAVRTAVVDMTQVQLAPGPVLRQLCQQVGIPYADVMHSGWQAPLPGPAIRDAVLTREVDASTGITPPLHPTPPFDHLPQTLRRAVERALAVYLDMLGRAHTPAADAAMERALQADRDVVRSNPLPFYVHLSTAPAIGRHGDRQGPLRALRRERPDLSGLFDRVDAWAAARRPATGS